MPSPFPGFDPYLENPQLWRGVHASLIVHISEELNRILPPGFDANIDERVYLIPSSLDIYPDVALLSRPHNSAPTPLASTAVATVLTADPSYTLTPLLDEEVERFIEVRVVGGSSDLVAVIEVLSPTNKTLAGYGRDSYRRKQEQLAASGVHLLEIDLLRSGLDTAAVERVVARQQGRVACDYLVCLSRATTTRTVEYWPISLRARLPRVKVPLLADLPDMVLDVQSCFERAYENGPYRRRIDYRLEPEPPLAKQDAEWADGLLRAKGRR